jgi:hypothetical protein
MGKLVDRSVWIDETNRVRPNIPEQVGICFELMKIEGINRRPPTHPRRIEPRTEVHQPHIGVRLLAGELVVGLPAAVIGTSDTGVFGLATRASSAP